MRRLFPSINPFRWATVLLLLLALALRAWGLNRWGLWYDEAYCWWIVSQIPLREMLTISAREIVPPLYYFLLRAWVSLAGATEFALRWPSVLSGVFAVACVGRLGWRLTNRRAGALAAMALSAVAPPLLWASREVRMYGLALTWTLLAAVALLEVFAASSARRRRLWAWLWTGATLAGLYTLALVGFWLIGQLLIVLALAGEAWFLSHRLPREEIKSLALPALTVVLLYLPWTGVAMRMVPLNQTYWHGYLPPLALLRRSLGGVTVMEYLPSGTLEGVAGLILVSGLIALIVSRPRRSAALYPFLYAVPLLIIALAYQRIPKWSARHASLFAPISFLPFAIAWGSVRRVRPWGLKAVSLLVVAATTALYGRFVWEADRNLLTNPAYAREDWRGAARYIQAHRAPNDIVIISTGSIFPAWLYYAGDEGMLPLPNDPMLDVTHILTYPDVAPQLNAALASCNPCDVWLVAWLDDVTDPTGLVEALLEDVGEEQPVPDFRGLKVRRFHLREPTVFPPDPPVAERPNVELLPGIRLWGYTLSEAPHPADRPLELQVWWTLDSPEQVGEQTYSASFRLRDGLGIEWGQEDHPLAKGNFPLHRWPPGVPVLSRFSLKLPVGIPPGLYTPVLILYTPGSAETMDLPPLLIAQPATPPEMPAEFASARPEGEGDAPLALLGVHLFQDTAAMCRQIVGEFFWEVRQPLQEEYTVAVGIGEHWEENPLFPHDTYSLLRPGDRVRSYFQLAFPCRALDIQANLEVRLLRADGTETGEAWLGPQVTVQTGRVFTEPTVPYEPAEAEFGPGFATLLGYRLDPPEVRAGEPFTVTLIWQAGCTDDVPRSVFVHITPPDAPSPLVAQHDGWPVLGARPTHTWVQGEVIVDAHPLPGLPAGTYQIRVGLYGPDGKRLPVSVGAESPPDRAISFPLQVDGGE
ncbi:MAG TPA: hypothetical protein ENK08_10910 [Chloroflexi bacterium]|nr:hypothetical protein [Chloroflexota bacterium]